MKQRESRVGMGEMGREKTSFKEKSKVKRGVRVSTRVWFLPPKWKMDSFQLPASA